MTVLWCLLWGFLIAVALLALFDFARDAIRHARWRRRFKSDSASEYHTFRNSLDRARRHSTPHHRPSRQRR